MGAPPLDIAPFATRLTTSLRIRELRGSVHHFDKSREELKARLDSGASPVLVDARLKYPYEHSTVKLPGSLRVTAGSPLPSLPKDREVVVYDSDPNEIASSSSSTPRATRGCGAATISAITTSVMNRPND